MTTTTQQIPSYPALDFANAVLAETDGAREIIHMLHDIAQGVRENATAQDRINASRILLDRGLGKCPKQPPVLSPVEGPATGSNPNPDPAPEPKVKKEVESPRLVTQLDNSLHRTLGPAPSACPEPSRSAQPEGDAPIISDTPEPFDPYSIQQYILDITDNCRTLMTVLTDIYRAPDDDPKVKESHRVRAGRMLIDRIMAMYPTAVRRAAEANTPAHPERSGAESKGPNEEFVPDPKWLEALQEIKRMEDEGIITPDPNAPKIDMSIYMKGTDEEIAPYAAEATAKLKAELDLRIERQEKWPEIEERRRKKLAQIYPSHSENDSEQPET